VVLQNEPGVQSLANAEPIGQYYPLGQIPPILVSVGLAEVLFPRQKYPPLQRPVGANNPFVWQYEPGSQSTQIVC
jgi:hypothetical protein